ncbi:MAG TPA: hypothetical protein DCE41_16400, partial [Cytophagales bacterium]|nr:hypothetical protein [Cytophagales bacterium]
MSIGKYVLYALVWIGVSTPARAQENSLFSHAYINPYFYNPAFAGSQGGATIYGVYRQQFVGINGAPQTTAITYHQPIGEKIGVGAYALNDSRGLLNTASFLGTFVYQVELTRDQSLRMGISTGVGSNSIDLTGTNPDDPAILNALGSSFYLEGQAGIVWSGYNATVGASIPSLFGTNFATDQTFTMPTLAAFGKYIFSGSYRLNFGKQGLNKYKYTLEPTVLYRLLENQPDQFEVASLFWFNDIGWIGANYRHNGGGVHGTIGMDFRGALKVGYTFELGLNNQVSNNLLTHEVVLGYNFSRQLKKQTSAVLANRREQLEERRRAAAAAAAAAEPEPTPEPEPEPVRQPEPEPTPEPEPEPVRQPEPEP